jgi:hypothetical protein
MKVLRQVCVSCGYIMFFSVEVLSRPDTDPDIDGTCPWCEHPQRRYFTATEIDMEEVAEGPDLETLRRTVAAVMTPAKR